ETGCFVRFDRRHKIGISVVYRAFFKRTRAQMAVQAFTVVVRLVQVNGLRDSAEVLHVHVPQSVQLGAESAKHCIIGVAGETGVIGGGGEGFKKKRRAKGAGGQSSNWGPGGPHRARER